MAYTATGKRLKAPVLIAKKKEPELEDPKWTDKVFTGDPSKNTAALTYFARQREMNASNGGPGRVITVDQNVGERLFGFSRKKAASTLVKDENTL